MGYDGGPKGSFVSFSSQLGVGLCNKIQDSDWSSVSPEMRSGRGGGPKSGEYSANPTVK